MESVAHIHAEKIGERWFVWFADKPLDSASNQSLTVAVQLLFNELELDQPAFVELIPVHESLESGCEFRVASSDSSAIRERTTAPAPG